MTNTLPTTPAAALPTETEILAKEGITRDTLESFDGRARTILSAIGHHPEVAAIMQLAGYDQAAHDQGYALLDAVNPRKIFKSAKTDVAKAFDEIDKADEDLFASVHSALFWDFKVQYEWLVEGLSAHDGPESAVDTSKLLARIDELESGKRAHADVARDAAAVLALAQLGVTPQRREHLKGLCALTRTLPQIPTGADGQLVTPAQTATAAHEIHIARLLALAALRPWVEKWSSRAKLRVKSRRNLIRLGLASPRVKKDPKLGTEKETDFALADCPR